MGHAFQESRSSFNQMICLKIFHFSFSNKIPAGSKKVTIPSHLEENNSFEGFFLPLYQLH